jgi:hypothetical protein
MCGPPSSEGTEAICRVPSGDFSQAPWYTLPVHLCRFRVRSIRGGSFLERGSKPGQSNKTRHLLAFVTTRRPRNIHLVPIVYALRPRLRGRLTRSGLALLRNPWTFGEGASHSLYRYLCQHSHFSYLHGPSPDRFTGLENAPLPISHQLSGIRDQTSLSYPFARYRRTAEIKPCSMRAISWYASRHICHCASWINPKSKQ